MSKLRLIITHEYLTEIRSKGFWVSTFFMLALGFGFAAFMIGMESESGMAIGIRVPGAPVIISGSELVRNIGIGASIFLVMFLLLYGSKIYNKVKVEKTNRIMEVMATCVSGRTMMHAKIISVGLTGLTQLAVWFGITVFAFPYLTGGQEFLIYPCEYSCADIVGAAIWALLFTAGGYIFYGALFAAAGAVTDRNNENQGMVAVLTVLILCSFYLSQWALEDGNPTLLTVAGFIPFTSPVAGCVEAVTGETATWLKLLQIAALYLSAYLSLRLSGAIYSGKRT